jgi:hypothetical protein
MTRFPATPALIAAWTLAAWAFAASDASAQGTHEVQGLTVVPGPGPAVKSTYPAAGASVPGGVVVLKIVFDQPMTPDAWAYGRSADADAPDCLAKPRLLADQRTFVLLCTVSENHAYAVDINAAPRFASTLGRSAQPYTLKFSTTGDMTRALHDALSQAGLDDVDDPIMTWGDPGQGVPQTAAAP